MRKICFLFLICCALFLAVSCTTTGSVSSDKSDFEYFLYTVSDTADMAKYKYVYIKDTLDYNIVADWFDLKVNLFDSLPSTGLTPLGEKEAESLSYEGKEHLLILVYSFSGKEYLLSSGFLALNFYDYLTLRPVCSYGFYVDYSYSPKYEDFKNALTKLGEFF